MAFSAYIQAICERPISQAWRGYGSAIGFEFGKLTPQTRRDGSPTHATGELSLIIEWSWRIEKGSEIVCGSWGNEELWDVWLKRLIGQQVERLDTFGCLPEISVTTADNLRVLSFATTEGQPEWSLRDRRKGGLPTLIVVDGLICKEA